MILVQNGRESKVCNDVNEAIDYINSLNIHPSLVSIYVGDFNKITYEQLLQLSGKAEINKDLLNQEVKNIRQSLLNAMDKSNYKGDGFLLEFELYPNGSLTYNSTLGNIGFNPLLVFSLQFRAAGDVLSTSAIPPEIPTKKIRQIAVQCGISGWQVAKVQQEKEFKTAMSYAWREYLIFFTKNRDLFLVKKEIGDDK